MNTTDRVRRPHWWRSLLAAGLVLSSAACGPKAADQKQTAGPSALVRTAPAVVLPVETTLRLYGAADAGTASSRALTALSESILLTVEKPVGSRVRAGDVVARLKPSPVSQLDLARARSDAAVAVSQYARMRRLRADGLASDADVETARLAAQGGRATVESLTLRQASLVLRSPIDGFVSTVNASPGDALVSGMSVATIVPSSARRARFGIDPEEARLVRPGALIRIVAANGDARYGVPVRSVDPGVDPTTRLAAVYADLPEGTGIGAGEPLIGLLAVRTSTGLPTIPYEAILSDAGQPYTFVVRKGVARRADLVVGDTSRERAAIKAGIKPGDIVVTRGGTALEDGVKVRFK